MKEDRSGIKREMVDICMFAGLMTRTLEKKSVWESSEQTASTVVGRFFFSFLL